MMAAVIADIPWKCQVDSYYDCNKADEFSRLRKWIFLNNELKERYIITYFKKDCQF